ncbi:MAG: substrate-binding domain-containing protein [Pirellulales bacterium]|nr:substrate-binding domain-containing protein [Pirellulales bacterium]
MAHCKSFLAALLCSLPLVSLTCLGCHRAADSQALGHHDGPLENFRTGKAERGTGAASNSTEPKRLIMLTNGDDPFWDAMRAGMEDAEQDLKLTDAGLKVELDKNDNTPKGQIDKLTQYGNQTDIAAVAISSTDARSTQIADAMRALLQQGIEVVTIDSDVDRRAARDARFAYLGTDNIIGGRELGKAARALRPNGGNYAAFVGLKSAANAQERIQGFSEGAGEALQQLEYLGDEMDLSVAAKNVRDALDRNPKIDTLVGIWAYNAPAIASTVKERSIRAKTKVVVFDAHPGALLGMEEGLIDALVVQNPYEMGYQGVRLMKALVENDQATIAHLFPSWNATSGEFTRPDGDLRITGLKVVVPDENTPLKKDMFESSTEFLKLSDFKQWLAKYKLKGS